MNTIRRKMVSALLTLVMLASLLPTGALPAQAAGETLTGNGSADNPYQIADAEDLKAFREIINTAKDNTEESTKCAILMEDIDLNYEEWVPIGNSEVPYSGIFNGNGKEISGLKIENTSQDVGLFGCIDQYWANNYEGTVQNLTVSGSVSGSNSVGGIVGRNLGTITGCINKVTVEGTDDSNFGGIAGYNGGSVENCINQAAISGSYSNGGIIGYNNGTVKGCSNQGNVSGTANSSYTGGIVGYNAGTVENCSNTATVDGYTKVGGVVGGNLYGTEKTTNCYNTGNVSGADSDSGGIVGDGLGDVTNCYYLTTSAQNAGKGMAKDETVFHSGEVAWLLQDGQDETVWVQSNLRQNESWPELKALASSNAKQVFKVSFTVNEADYVTPQYVNNGDIVSLPEANPTPAEGFGFIGWEENGQLVTGAITVTKDITCTPRWGEIFDVTLDTNGGTIAEDKKLTEYISGVGATLPTADDITKAGYIFGGWYESADFSGTKVEKIDATETDNKTYHAKWISTGTGVTSVVVAGETATPSGDNAFSVTLPADSAFSADIKIVIDTADENATASTPTTNDGGKTWTFTVTAEDGTTTQNYTINVTIALPSITTQPANQTVTEGDTATFSVVADVTTGVSYQWQMYENGAWTDITNAKSSTYTINATTLAMDGTQYRCEVTGKGGSTTSDAATLTVNEKTYNITIQTDGGGTASASQNPATRDTIITLTAEPDVGYVFKEWQVVSGGVTITDNRFTMPASDVTVKAIFEEVGKHTITLTADPDAGGNVSGGGDVTAGTDATITAEPNEGYSFVNWTTKDGTEVSTEASYTIQNIQTDHSYVAHFAQKTYDVIVTAGEGGTASGGQKDVPHGTEITVTAEPNVGYHFVNWTDGYERSTSASFTFKVTTDWNLTANFEVNPTNPSTPSGPSEPAEPEGPATEYSEGWSAIEDELAAADDGDEIAVDMNGATEVPASVLENAAGKNVNLTLDLGDGVSWTVNGADIPTDADLSDLDLGVTMDSDGIPVNVIDTVTNERTTTVQMTLAHDGEFGFTMTLSAPLGKKNAGLWANLYRYDEDAEAMTFETATLIDEDGNAKLPMSHASQYAIVIDDHSHAAEEPSALPFTDVNDDDWFSDVVRYVYEQGLMTGTSDTEFSPNLTTTRGMIVSILNRLEGGPTAEAAGFNDVADGDWYAEAVNWAASEGIVAGYEDGSFRPNDPITREQLAAMLMNYAAWKGEDVSARADLSSYNDAASVSSWAAETVQWAVAEGLISGMPGNLLEPQGSATRAQVAAILERFLEQ